MVDKEQQNNYFGDMKGYIDKINSILAEKNSWKTIAFISSGISILAVSGMIYIGSASKFVPMVFYTDTSGAMQFGGIASDNLRITQPMVANQVAEYIISLRQIPMDMDVKTEYLNKLKMMTDPAVYTNIVYPMLKDRYTNNIGKSIKVRIKNVIPISNTTYQIDWVETENQQNRGIYRSTISFTMTDKFTDPAVALYDPLGLVINDININQEVE